jgi:flagellar biosynthesis GTPase FlhF
MVSGPVRLDVQRISISKEKNVLVQWYVKLHPHQPLANILSNDELLQAFDSEIIQNEMVKIISLGIHEALNEPDSRPVYSDNVLVTILRHKCTISPDEIEKLKKSSKKTKDIQTSDIALQFQVQITSPDYAKINDYVVKPSSAPSPFKKTPQKAKQVERKSISSEEQKTPRSSQEEPKKTPRQERAEESESTPTRRRRKSLKHSERKTPQESRKEEKEPVEEPAEQKKYAMEDVIEYVDNYFNIETRKFRKGTVKLFYEMYDSLSEKAKAYVSQLIHSYSGASAAEQPVPASPKRKAEDVQSPRKRLKLKNPDDL